MDIEWAGRTNDQIQNLNDNQMRNDFKMFVFKLRCHFYKDLNLK
jgi:hypothetical protein